MVAARAEDSDDAQRKPANKTVADATQHVLRISSFLSLELMNAAIKPPVIGHTSIGNADVM